MIPTPITDHVERGKARLTSMFRGRAVIEGLLKVYLGKIQTLENEFWLVINGRSIDTAIGAQLDKVGALVLETRDGRADADYREAIRLKVLILRSTGRVVDVLRIINIASKGAYWEYRDAYPAGFHALFTGDVPAFRALAHALTQAKPNGVGRNVLYGTPHTELFRPSSCVGVASKARGPSHTDGLERSVSVHVSPLP